MHLNGKRKNKKNGILLIFHHSIWAQRKTFILSTKPTGKLSSSISPIFLNGSSANAFVALAFVALAFVALAPNTVPINRTIEGRSKVFERKIIQFLQKVLVYMNFCIIFHYIKLKNVREKLNDPQKNIHLIKNKQVIQIHLML